jgi:hypothetical protein
MAKKPTPKQIEEWRIKAEKWNKLNEKIHKCYFDENGDELAEDEEPGLDVIGEYAAAAFGYL